MTAGDDHSGVPAAPAASTPPPDTAGSFAVRCKDWAERPFVWGTAAAGFAIAAGLGLLADMPLTAGPLAAAAGLGVLGLAWSVDRRRGLDRVARLLMAAAETSLDACLITTADGRFVYANAAFLRLFATAASLDAMGSLLDDGERWAEAFRRLRAAAEAGVSGAADLPVKGVDGAIEWRQVSVWPLAGQPPHAIWRASDITARREMDSVRQREEEALADFLDNLPAGFFSVDAEGRILHANATLAAWLGLPAARMRAEGMAFADFVVASGANWRSEGDEPAMNGEVTLEAADGTTFPALLLQSMRAADDGAMLYSRSLVLRDVAWKIGEGDSVALALSRLHWLFDEAPVGIVLLDLHGNVTDCNRAFLKLLGIHREAVAGRPLAERMSKEDRSDLSVQLSKVVMGTSRAAHVEVRMPAAGGRELTVSLYASRMEDNLGEVSGLVLHFIDTTEQKTLEVQFTQAQKIHAVGQLAGGIAHDFNNMLTAIIGFSDLLLARHGPEDPSFADLMQVKHNANRATNLVRQLLAFSRKQTLKPVDIDIGHALADLSHMLRRLMGETIELSIESAPDLGMVRVDPVQFDQVIINLAVNSRDAMPRGGTLSIHTSSVQVDEPINRGHELMPSGSYVLIKVSDTGAGIPKESIGHIFEPFFSTKEKGSGTGLGLSTVYGIVRQTGGFIFVDSAPGEGTVFDIYLPEIVDAAAWRPAPAAAAERDTSEVDLTGGGTVLLVEDEEAVRMFGARALRNKGYKVLEADSGEGALDVINSSGESIDLIISDVVMPGMDGHTFVRLVRQELPEVKVILVSGYAEETVAGDIQRDPTLHFLPKPYSLQQLAGKAKDVLTK
ncbi:PAS domain-containing hybrid sensor histidine kinase/response regulator [Shumkonia mesophila]|uniref:PAS domain-containing hybrid sensor histidine kinase/response regulator n=1 Tax=Shumkonia mesophila TaxID=2838854 RepID=UPI0029351162|nr:PAS domain-containing protein [Shumkonia mesophila]